MTLDVHYVPNVGTAVISTANTNLNGTGSITTLVTGASDGTLIKTLTIKALGDTSLGMIRLFLYNGSSNFLIREIMIPANDQTSVVQSFSAIVNLQMILKPGYSLNVSTQNAESFSVIADAENWINCECAEA